jgi:hypothetical protein
MPAERTKLTLPELLNAANRNYCDGYISEYFDATTGRGKKGSSGDTLAEFIVREIGQTFDEESSRKDQVRRAVRVLECAKVDLQSAINGLKELR